MAIGSLDAARAYVSLARFERSEIAMITLQRIMGQQARLTHVMAMLLIVLQSLLYVGLNFLLIPTLLNRAFLKLFHRNLFVLLLRWRSDRFDMFNPRVVYRPAKDKHDGRNAASAFVMSASHGMIDS